MAPQELLALADRVDSQRGVSNKLDAEIEIALFNPPEDGFASVRRNNAGSKLIYTHHDGREVTSWAMDWTMDRPRSSGLLRALATSGSQHEGASS